MKWRCRWLSRAHLELARADCDGHKTYRLLRASGNEFGENAFLLRFVTQAHIFIYEADALHRNFRTGENLLSFLGVPVSLCAYSGNDLGLWVSAGAVSLAVLKGICLLRVQAQRLDYIVDMFVGIGKTA